MGQFLRVFLPSLHYKSVSVSDPMYLESTVIVKLYFSNTCGWSGGAIVLGKLPVPGRPTIWITVGQGPTALAVGAERVVWTFLLLSILSFLFLTVFKRRPDID